MIKIRCLSLSVYKKPVRLKIITTYHSVYGLWKKFYIRGGAYNMEGVNKMTNDTF